MSSITTITIAHGRGRHLLNQGRTLQQGTSGPIAESSSPWTTRLTRRR